MDPINPLKISGIFLVAVIILMSSWFIFKTNFTIPSATPETSFKEALFGNNTENPLNNLNVDNLKNLFKNQISGLSVTSTTSTENQNLTDQIGETMASKILGASKDLLNYKSGEMSPEQQQINDALANQLKDQNYFPLDQPIAESVLKITSVNSPSTKKQYLESLQNTIQKCFGEFNKNAADILKDAFERGDISSAKKLSGIYGCSYDNLINITVPSEWLNIHKDLLVYYENAKIIYEAIGDYQNDPLKAYLALNEIENLINSAEQNQTILDIKAKSVGL